MVTGGRPSDPGGPGGLVSASAALREPVARLRSAARGLAHHAPDAGPPPAPDAVASVLAAALAAVESLADDLDGTSARLAAAAVALAETDAAVERRLRRV